MCGVAHSEDVRRGDGFKRGNTFSILSIKTIVPTPILGLRGGFETTSKQLLTVGNNGFGK